MPTQGMEHFIKNVLTGDSQKNALHLAAYLKANELSLARGSGYWADKLYWVVTYHGECVCYVLLNDPTQKTEPWIIWSDDNGSNWYSDFPLDEALKELAWKHVDFCVNCGGACSPKTHKIIFGKAFRNVCRTTMRFIDPDAETLACVKKMIDIRKFDILQNLACTQ